MELFGTDTGFRCQTEFKSIVDRVLAFTMTCGRIDRLGKPSCGCVIAGDDRIGMLRPIALMWTIAASKLLLTLIDRIRSQYSAA